MTYALITEHMDEDERHDFDLELDLPQNPVQRERALRILQFRKSQRKARQQRTG